VPTKENHIKENVSPDTSYLGADAPAGPAPEKILSYEDLLKRIASGKTEEGKNNPVAAAVEGLRLLFPDYQGWDRQVHGRVGALIKRHSMETFLKAAWRAVADRPLGDPLDWIQKGLERSAGGVTRPTTRAGRLPYSPAPHERENHEDMLEFQRRYGYWAQAARPGDNEKLAEITRARYEREEKAIAELMAKGYSRTRANCIVRSHYDPEDPNVKKGTSSVEKAGQTSAPLQAAHGA
jgi:hypothetical protein